ncbi:hypothetical protein ABKN59_010771 [Abortiporus biennis]
MPSHIASLPDEILSEIFLIYRLVNETKSFQRVPRNLENHYIFFRITHVCRRWRQVAHQTPLLWTNIVCYPRVHAHKDIPVYDEIVSTMLELSQAVPLRFTLQYNWPEHPKLVTALRENIHRITYLLANIPTSILGLGAPIIFELFKFPIPQLRHLHIVSSQLPSELNPEQISLSGAQLPVLESLSLENFPMETALQLIRPTLKSFSFTQMFSRRVVPRNTFLHALLSMPSLEILEIVNGGFGQWPSPPPTLISLHRIKKITIVDGFDILMWFLSVLRIPRDAHLGLSISSPLDYISLQRLQDFSHKYKALLDFSFGGPRPKPVDVTLHVGAPGFTESFRIEAFSQFLTEEELDLPDMHNAITGSSFEPVSPSSFYLSFPASSRAVFTKQLCSSLPLDDAQRICLTIVEPNLGRGNIDNIVGVLFRMVSIQTLYIQGGRESDIVQIFQATTQQAARDHIFPPLPALRFVKLKGVHFDIDDVPSTDQLEALNLTDDEASATNEDGAGLCATLRAWKAWYGHPEIMVELLEGCYQAPESDGDV